MAARGPPIFLRARTLSTRSSRLRKNSFWLLRPSQVSKFERTLTGRAGCSKWPSSKAAASEEANRTLFSPGPPITCQNRCYPRPYVELLSDARTPLARLYQQPAKPFGKLRTGLSKSVYFQPVPFMVRQAHHERNGKTLMRHCPRSLPADPKASARLWKAPA